MFAANVDRRPKFGLKFDLQRMPTPPRPTRLVIDGRRLDARRTGVGRYLEVLLGGWADSGLPLEEGLLVLADRSGLPLVPTIPGLRVEVAGEGLPGLAWEVLALGPRLRKGDLLLAPANLIPPSWRGPTLLVLHDALMASRPGDFPRSARWRFARRYRSAARRASLIVVPSAATAAEAGLHYGVDPSRIRVIPPAVDPRFRPDPARAEAARGSLGLGDRPYFLFVGKPSKRRNVGAILDGFARARAQLPDHRLVLAGPGLDGPRYRAEGVEAIGYVPEPHLPGLYAGATALIYPSEAEGFGLPVAEAMAVGCPVVVLRGGAPAEVAGDAALRLDDPSPEAIAAEMLRSAVEDADRDRRVEVGLRRAADLSPGRCARAVAAATRELIAAQTRSGMGSSRW